MLDAKYILYDFPYKKCPEKADYLYCIIYKDQKAGLPGARVVLANNYRCTQNMFQTDGNIQKLDYGDDSTTLLKLSNWTVTLNEFYGM